MCGSGGCKKCQTCRHRAADAAHGGCLCGDVGEDGDGLKVAQQLRIALADKTSWTTPDILRADVLKAVADANVSAGYTVFELIYMITSDRRLTCKAIRLMLGYCPRRDSKGNVCTLADSDTQTGELLNLMVKAADAAQAVGAPLAPQEEDVFANVREHCRPKGKGRFKGCATHTASEISTFTTVLEVWLHWVRVCGGQVASVLAMSSGVLQVLGQGSRLNPMLQDHAFADWLKPLLPAASLFNCCHAKFTCPTAAGLPTSMDVPGFGSTLLFDAVAFNIATAVSMWAAAASGMPAADPAALVQAASAATKKRYGIDLNPLTATAGLSLDDQLRLFHAAIVENARQLGLKFGPKNDGDWLAFWYDIGGEEHAMEKYADMIEHRYDTLEMTGHRHFPDDDEAAEAWVERVRDKMSKAQTGLTLEVLGERHFPDDAEAAAAWVERVRDSMSTTLEEKAAVRFPDDAEAAAAWVQRVRDSLSEAHTGLTLEVLGKRHFPDDPLKAEEWGQRVQDKKKIKKSYKEAEKQANDKAGHGAVTNSQHWMAERKKNAPKRNAPKKKPNQPSKRNMEDTYKREEEALKVRDDSAQKDLVVDRKHNMFAKWAFILGTKDLNREITLAGLKKSSGLGEELMRQVREFRAKAKSIRADTKKRKAKVDAAPSTIAGKRKRKAKVDAPELDVEGMCKAGTLKKAKVSELKAFLFSKDVKPKGKKADLLEQVEELLA